MYNTQNSDKQTQHKLLADIHVIFSWYQLIPCNTCKAARIVRKIQRRVRPLLTDPPNLVNNVCSSMLKAEWATSTVLSKTMMSIIFGSGDVWRNFDEYTFFVQGVLQLKTLLWKYIGVNRVFRYVSFAPEKLNLSLHILFVSFSKRRGTHPISFRKISFSSLMTHLL